jgi:glycine/D-amino acid oxidase-like deaminating enzyme
MPESLWAATALPAPAAPALEGERKADVAIVGGGFAGLRAALVLAEAGSDVVLLEAAEPGWGASGRNGGQVNPLLPVNTPEETRALIGPTYGERLIELAIASADEVFSLVARYGIDCDARQDGWIRAARYPGPMRDLERHAASWRRAGADIAFAEGAELATLTGTDYYRLGAVTRRGGAIQPLSFARGLAAAAIAAGASVHGGSPVASLTREDGGWRLATPAGSVLAGRVLLCTNGYTDGLRPGLKQTVIPVISAQMATRPLPHNLRASMLPEGHTFADARRLVYYGRFDRDGRFLLGGIGFTEQSGDHPSFRRIMRVAIDIFPQLRGVEWEFRWGGRVAMTRDHLPHLHEPAPGLLAGLGFNGRGVAMATVMGRILAERALGADPADLPLPTTPLRGYPLHAFHPLGLRSHIAWLGLRDGLDGAMPSS